MRKYDSYKDSGVEWIGEIPSGWEVVKLKRLTKVKRGSSPRPIDDPKFFDDLGEFKWVRISDVTNSERYLYETSETLSELGSSLSTKIYPNDLFLSIAGSVGKPIIPKVKCCIHDGFVWFDGLKYNSEFLYYTFLLGTCFSGLGKWGTQLNLNTDTVGDIFIPLIDLELQQQIVSYLDTKTSLIDSLIEKTQLKIELLKENRTSLINEVVTKGLNPNVEMKDSGVEWIGEIPINYQMISIKFLVTIPVTDGPHETPTFIDEGIPFLSVNGVVGNTIDFNRVRGYISEELHIQYSKKCKPQRDDVLLVKSGSTTGKSTIVESDLDFNIWSPLCIIRSNKNKIIPRFTFQTFQSGYFRLLIENNWSYGTQPNIGMEVIENLSIVVPPLSEQNEIVSYLDEHTQLIDKTISIEERRIELLKDYRQSLISEVVTGKRKVVD